MIKPLPGYVLVEPIKEEAVSGGIYLPEDVNDKPMKGKIIAIGDWIKNWRKEWEDKLQIKVNDIVLYKKWTNQEVKFEGKEYLLVAYTELLGVIE